MSLKRNKIMNADEKARKDATTNQAEPHSEPTFEQIQVRAYEIYIQRGRQDGCELDDWFQAEKELKTSSQNHRRVIGQVERVRASYQG